jgi:hypothetical protein
VRVVRFLSTMNILIFQLNLAVIASYTLNEHLAVFTRGLGLSQEVSVVLQLDGTARALDLGLTVHDLVLEVLNFV